MDHDFFETALASGKLDKFVVTETAPGLVNKYKGNCEDCENLALEFVSNRPVPVISDYIKVDSTFKLDRTISLIRTKKAFEDDMQSYAIHLVGLTDLYVCSILNDGLVPIYQKTKDRESKIRGHRLSIQVLWSSFFYKFNSEFNLDVLFSIKSLLQQWNYMLRKTKHKELFDEASYRADKILKSLKNLKDKCVGTSDGIENISEDISETSSSKKDKKKRHYESLCEIEELLKSIDDSDILIESPPKKKPKIGLHKYFIASNDSSDDSPTESNEKEPLKETLLENGIESQTTPKADVFTEKLDVSDKSPVKQFINVEEKENDVDITYFSSNKNIVSPAGKNSTPSSGSVKKSLQYETPSKKNAYQIMMEAARKRSETKRK